MTNNTTVNRLGLPFTSFKEWLSFQDEDLQNQTDDTHLSEYLTYLKSHNIVQYNYILQLDSPCKQES